MFTAAASATFSTTFSDNFPFLFCLLSALFHTIIARSSLSLRLTHSQCRCLLFFSLSLSLSLSLQDRHSSTRRLRLTRCELRPINSTQKQAMYQNKRSTRFHMGFAGSRYQRTLFFITSTTPFHHHLFLLLLLLLLRFHQSAIWTHRCSYWNLFPIL